MTYHPEFFAPPPEMKIGAASVEFEDYPRLFRGLAWIVNGDVAKEIGSRSFTNIRLENDLAEEQLNDRNAKFRPDRTVAVKKGKGKTKPTR